eukprot:jgi/Astpho2/1352/Aster-06215
MSSGIATALVALLALATSAVQAGQTEKPIKLADGTSAEVSRFEGVPKWQLLSHLWRHHSINVTCPEAVETDVFVAKDLPALREAAEQQDEAWCGVAHWLGEQRSCCVSVSPFGDTWVAVRPRKAGLMSRGTSGCQLSKQEQPNPWLPAAALAGVLLFFNADRLSRSMFFRISSGTLSIMLLAVLIVMFLGARSLPNKKSMMAAFALFGSSFTTLMRCFFGRWVPSWRQLLHSKAVQGYLLLSGLVGGAVTYYYDDDRNVKLQKLLRAGLMLIGLGLVYWSTSMTEASLVLCGLLMLSVPLNMLLQRRTTSLRQQLADVTDTLSGLASHGQARAPRLPKPAGEVPQYIPRPEPPPAHSKTPDSTALQRAMQRPLPDDMGVQSPQHLTHRASAHDYAVSRPVSPIVQQGKIFNQATGKVINIGKSTYNKLILEGYVADREHGVLTPPGPLKGA